MGRTKAALRQVLGDETKVKVSQRRSRPVLSPEGERNEEDNRRIPFRPRVLERRVVELRTVPSYQTVRYRTRFESRSLLKWPAMAVPR